MKKLFFVFLFSVLLIDLSAQNVSFEQILPLPNAPQNIAEIRGVVSGSSAFADVDNDGDKDLFITGAYNGSYCISNLYINDGAGNYTLNENTPFEGVHSSSIAFADIDGDSDLDLLVTGYNSDSREIIGLYLNDGLGNFTLEERRMFTAVRSSSVAFADIDGDSDQDVLLTGRTSWNEHITHLYKNDGYGFFTKVENTSFTGVSFSSIAFADVDGDEDQDIFISGYSPKSNVCELYINDGSGSFALFNDSFVGVRHSSIAVADVDGDDDLDLVVAGINDNSSGISNLYKNDGKGNFSKMDGTFVPAYSGSIAFADVDGDNDPDLLITGLDENIEGSSNLYINDGDGNFTLYMQSDMLKGVVSSSVAFADTDGDGDQDLLISGHDTKGKRFVSELYANNGSGKYSLVTGTPVKEIIGEVAYTDYDNDNDQDIFICGTNGSIFTSHLYSNDGTGNYSLVPNTPFKGVSGGSVALFDVDGDLDDDVLITGGINSNDRICELYINEGKGIFALALNTPFRPIFTGDIAVADIDGDNDLDVLMAGVSGLIATCDLYTNNGNGDFTLVREHLFTGIRFGSVEFADVDRDSDLDLFITGNTHTSNGVWQGTTELYINDGNGVFSRDRNNAFTSLTNGSIAIADIDNDRDLDVVMAGLNSQDSGVTEIYFNDGRGSYAKAREALIEGVRNGNVAFSDIDGDGNQDLFVSGMNNTDQLIAQLYLNDGIGNYSKEENM
ncbi:MAG: FG-GAP repeat domain-containing protein, partial [Bacteroidia bacterium]